ncbi:MAG: DUF3015 family protein [Burkholderiales bacterium]|nr:DUF3015 family protein [Burkholderiales bacterium]
MKKIILASAIVLASTASFAAANNVGCGLGTVVMGGQSGPGPQVLAVTTNGVWQPDLRHFVRHLGLLA